MSALSPASVCEDGCDRKAVQSTAAVDPNRACKVCGDKANGYNFGVLTCESCKAFFRRNAAKEHEIVCPFSNSCGITPASRRYCQSCRLKKCFAVGMSREWLLEQKNKPENPRKRLKKEEIDTDSEEEVSVSKAYLKELMRKAKGRPTSCECTCTCGYFPAGTKLAPNVNQLMRPAVAAAHFPLVGLPTAALAPEASPLFALPQTNFSLASSALSSPGPSAFSPLAHGPLSCEPPVTGEPRLSAEEYTRLLQMSRGSMLPSLSQEESDILQELIRVAQPLNSPLDMSLGDHLSILDVVKITEYALRRIVCMARDLSAFKSLPIEDRKTLMKGCSSELLILRGVMAFDAHKNMWLHSLSQGVGAMEVKLEVLQSVAEHPQHYEEHKRFLESIDGRVRKKETVILVLMAVLIFQPDRPGLLCVELVRAAQNRYLNLLRRLLAVEFGELEAPGMFTRLQVNLQELRHLNQSMVRVYYGFDQRQLDPLIKELFDM